MTESTVKPTAISLNAGGQIRERERQMATGAFVASMEMAEIIDRICVLPLLEALEGMIELESCTHRVPGTLNADWLAGIVEDAKAAIKAARG